MWRGSLALMLLLVPVLAVGQSLADVARREKERREDNRKRVGKTYIGDWRNRAYGRRRGAHAGPRCCSLSRTASRARATHIQRDGSRAVGNGVAKAE